MKKIRQLGAIIFFASVCISLTGQVRESKPKIKSIIITEEKSDMLIKKQLKDSETYFDERGNITEEINYKAGKIDKHFKYQYDNENNKIKEEEFDPAGRIMEYTEYRFEKGLRMEKNVFDANKKLKSRKVYSYTTY
jgi:hypothetical protein